MDRVGRRALALLTACAVALVPAHSAATAQNMSRADYEACQARDEAGFRSAIEAVTTQALQRGLAGIDYKAIVAAEWQRGDVDTIMAARIDEAVGELRQETSWLRLVETLASSKAAEALATSAAERVYQRSDAVKKAIEGIALGVGKEVGQRIELATADAADPAAQCMQAFLGPRYGSTVARVVARDTGREFAIDPAKGTAQVSAGQLILESGEGIAGTVVLVVRRQLSNMASRVGQRLIGAVLGRLVAVVAGGVGVVLIAKDVWELRHGVLPIIASEMKSTSTRDKVQDELAKSISEQIGEHVREIGAKTAERVVDIWREFKRAHTKVLEFAEQNDGFRRLLDSVDPSNLNRLDEVTALVLADEGEPAIFKRLDDGTLREAVEKLPAPALEIARNTRSLGVAFKWQALAGDALPKVVELELYRRTAPAEMSAAALTRILGLQDKVAITRLAAMKAAAREPLFELDDSRLVRLARALSETELQSLSSYMTGLERSAGQRFLAAIAQSPAKLQAIAGDTVRNAILQSRDQAAAVGMMLRSDTIFDPMQFGSDLTLVRDGRISPSLLWARYSVVLSILGLFGLMFLAVLWRLLFGRRAKAYG